MAQHLSFYRKIWVRLIHDKCFQILQTQLLFDACCRTICYLPCFRHDWLCFVFFMVIFVLYFIMLYIVSMVTSCYIIVYYVNFRWNWMLLDSLWIFMNLIALFRRTRKRPMSRVMAPSRRIPLKEHWLGALVTSRQQKVKELLWWSSHIFAVHSLLVCMIHFKLFQIRMRWSEYMWIPCLSLLWMNSFFDTLRMFLDL